MKKVIFVFLLTVMLLFSTSLVSVTASSAGGDNNTPPPAGGGGGGGGSPQFFDYYIPLIFGPTHKYNISEVVVYMAIPSTILTTFAQNEYGASVSQIREPTVLHFNPRDNTGLTNGSLIRLTAPAQVVGQRVTQDISNDHSFAYTILPRRMMGFEYDAPFDGSISLMSLNPQTKIQITAPDGTYNTQTIDTPGTTLTLPVVKGSYVNSSFPTIGAFYTDREGMSASLAVPRYLHGNLYYFNGDIATSRPNEIDRSYVRVNPSEPTPLTVYYSDGTNSTTNIFGITDLSLTPTMRGISAARGKLEVNIRALFDYGGHTRASTVQLMDIRQMRAAEAFITPNDYTSHFSSGLDDNQYNLTSYDPSSQSYVVQNRYMNPIQELHSVSIDPLDTLEYIHATNYLFGFSISPGKVSHPMAPSAAFVSVPLNSASSSNSNATLLNNTWYRFPNLAVMRVDIIPGPVEEYTGQLIQIEIKDNGTLPASQFKVEITIDEKTVVDETYDFLQVNQSIIYNLHVFLSIGQKGLNITVNVDVNNQVNEVNENDNSADVGYNVHQNFRLRVSFIMVVILAVVLAVYKIRTWLKRRRDVNRAHVDAILTFEEAN